MADRSRIGRALAEIAARPNAVTFEQVRQVVNQIRLLGETRVKERQTTHGYQFTIGSRIVRVKNNPRGPMKRCYVDDFLDAMVDLGFYED